MDFDLISLWFDQTELCVSVLRRGQTTFWFIEKSTE